MSILRKRWRIFFIPGLLLAIAAPITIARWAGSEIAGPTRRTLQDYHQEFLTNPTTHGLVITPFTAADGTPVLVCTPDPTGHLGERGSIIRKQLTERGINLPRAGKITGNIVLCHGRRGRKEDYLPIAERLCACGFRCILADMPAHGDHPNNIATYGVREASLPAALLDETSTHFGFNPQPAGLIGMSMGGSIAIHATALPQAPWKALTIISSFDSLHTVVEHQASRYLGTNLSPHFATAVASIYQSKSGIAMASIQPRKHAASIRIPTLIAHGTADEVVPYASGRQLFHALPESTTKRWIKIPHARHDNVLITDFPIYVEIAGWMRRHVK